MLTEKRISESTAVALHPADERAADATQVLADSFHEYGVLPREVDVRGFLLNDRFKPVREAVGKALVG